MTQKLIKEQITFSFTSLCPVSHHPIEFSKADLELKQDFLNDFKLVFEEIEKDFSYLNHDFLKWSFINHMPICFDYQVYSLVPLDENIYEIDGIMSLNFTIEILKGKFNSLVEQKIHDYIVSNVESISNKYGSQIRFAKSDKYRKYEVSDLGFRDY